tara:strand:+ start:393 stop:1559 length:1167 start_codon:yes stop_codon:yes gene_type:complete
MPGWELVDSNEKKALTNLFKGLKNKGVQKPIFLNGKLVKKFEKKFSQYIDAKYAVCVSSGTSAIKVALIAAGVTKGDEVITQSFTFIAVVEAILAVGAIPIITEVNDTLNMCPEDLKKKITKKTKVIMPVHMLGVACEVDKINKIAKKNKILVIDDNCEALGSKWGKKKLGVQADMCAWSFDSGKTITTGEGGMITTNNINLYKLCREYRDHGHENNPRFPRGRDTHRIYGFNYRVSEIVGALGLVQLKKIDTVIKNNEKYYLIYEKILTKFNDVKLRRVPRLNTPLKDCIIFNFKNKNIAKKVLFDMVKEKIATKNIPDALEWHFAKYWDHIFSKFNITKNKLLKSFPISSDYLERSISIFIYARDTEKNVINKSKKIEKILSKYIK